jgi:hypothetical protein
LGEPFEEESPMSQSKKKPQPASKEKKSKPRQSEEKELAEQELDKVSGGLAKATQDAWDAK